MFSKVDIAHVKQVGLGYLEEVSKRLSKLKIAGVRLSKGRYEMILSLCVLGNIWLLHAIVYYNLQHLNQFQNGTDIEEEGEYDLSRVTLKPGLDTLIGTSYVPITLHREYLMENKKLCTSVKNLTLIVTAYTAPANFDRRQIMRGSWLNNSNYLGLGTVRVVWLLGKTSNATLQRMLEEEFRQYGDLLQGDFVDHYFNLTHKGAMGFKWVAERCRNAKIVLKADDDMILNMKQLFTHILPRTILNQRRHLYCYRNPHSQILRDKKLKWFINENEFRGDVIFPVYCEGPAVFMTNDIVPALVKSAKMLPFFWLEDVYLYGVVLQNVPGLTYTQFGRGVEYDLHGKRVIKCFRETLTTCTFMIVACSNQTDMVEVWKYMQQQNEMYLPHIMERIFENMVLPP
ncbi:beta-1,3-galactosyltransferase 1-like [Mercenaria mercenaria]|uniref:beta-1,3-galactosyltransferase 1-like n=1 Tax=Mercenaria mercenaria TaxID=6596 RepID=UPI001E1DA562|nr:beta-1,3-galactosyltransferase 1-like [Mercenaria mercenaria]